MPSAAAMSAHIAIVPLAKSLFLNCARLRLELVAHLAGLALELVPEGHGGSSFAVRGCVRDHSPTICWARAVPRRACETGRRERPGRPRPRAPAPAGRRRAAQLHRPRPGDRAVDERGPPAGAAARAARRPARLRRPHRPDRRRPAADRLRLDHPDRPGRARRRPRPAGAPRGGRGLPQRRGGGELHPQGPGRRARPSWRRCCRRSAPRRASAPARRSCSARRGRTARRVRRASRERRSRSGRSPSGSPSTSTRTPSTRRSRSGRRSAA